MSLLPCKLFHYKITVCDYRPTFVPVIHVSVIDVHIYACVIDVAVVIVIDVLVFFLQPLPVLCLQ